MHPAFRILPFLLALGILMSACAPLEITESPTPAEPTEISKPQPTETRPAHPVVTPWKEGDTLLRLRQQLAGQFGLSVDDMTMIESREEVWSDGCLGAALPDEMCTLAIVPGYLLFFETPVGKIEVHTDQEMNLFRVVAPNVNSSGLLVVWNRSGGIAGICRQMSLLLDGSYQILDCTNQQPLAQGSLPQTTMDELLGLTNGMAPHDWATPPSQGADLFNDSYTWYGPGSSIPQPEIQEELNSFLGSLVGQLVK